VSDPPPRPLARDTLLDADALAPLAPDAPTSLPPPPPEGTPSTAGTTSAPGSAEDPDTLVSRTPDAKGTYGVTPLVYILVHALDRRFTGTLAVRREGQMPVLLMLDDGAVVRVDSQDVEHRLGEAAVSCGACSEALLATALAEAQREGTRLGLALVSKAGVAPEMLKTLLLLQTGKRVAQLVNLPAETSYTLHLGERAREPYEPWTPLDVILAAVRAWSDRPRIHGTMRFIGTRPLALHPDADLTHLVTLPSERAALDAMRSGQVNLEVLYRASGGGLSSLIYTLAVTRQFTFSADKGPPMGRPFAAAATAPAAAPHVLPLEASHPPHPAEAGPLATPYELEQSSPHAVVIPVLERPITESFAIADTSPGAFVRRTTAPYPIEPRPNAVGLARPSTPAAPAPPPTPPRAAPTRPGQDDFDLAESALARKDLKDAETHAIRATQADPKNPDYAALFAWVCAHAGEDALPESVRALTRVLEDHPKCESALLYRGTLLKRAGKEKAALRDFVMVLYQNPSHPQALVEVRELRRTKR
jgi:hypothetical protein